MVSLRPATVIGALCVSVALIGAPAATAQVPGPGPRVVVTDLPVLSELPPLPPEAGNSDSEADDEEWTLVDLSGVQATALVLAVIVLVAGGAGLALVTRRGQGAHTDYASGANGPGRRAR